MKKIFLNILLLLSSFYIYAQTENSTVSYSFGKQINAGEIAGRKFRYEMAVHSSNASPAHSLETEVLGRDKDGTIRKIKAVSEWRREQDWEILSLAAEADESIVYLSINTNITTKGEFYFDDLNMYVEITPGKWKQHSLSNPSFEEGRESIPGYSFADNKYYRLSRQVAKVGRQSLWVNLSSFKAESVTIPTE